MPSGCQLAQDARGPGRTVRAPGRETLRSGEGTLLCEDSEEGRRHGRRLLRYKHERVLFVMIGDLSRDLEKKWAIPRDKETVTSRKVRKL